jgi:hypothetical protein
MEDLDEWNGMNKKDQNEETKEAKKGAEECREKEQPSEEGNGEGRPIG